MIAKIKLAGYTDDIKYTGFIVIGGFVVCMEVPEGFDE